MTVVELKKLLVSRGFAIYRTLPEGVALVERVRENLILDSGIRVLLRAEDVRVQIVFRAEGHGFPGESEEQMFERARALTVPATLAGFSIAHQHMAPQKAPVNPELELDRFYEVTCELDGLDAEQACVLVTRAFGWCRSVPAH